MWLQRVGNLHVPRGTPYDTEIVSVETDAGHIVNLAEMQEQRLGGALRLVW